MTQPLHTLGVAELGRALASRDVSSTEITKHLLARVDAMYAALRTAVRPVEASVRRA